MFCVFLINLIHKIQLLKMNTIYIMWLKTYKYSIIVFFCLKIRHEDDLERMVSEHKACSSMPYPSISCHMNTTCVYGNQTIAICKANVDCLVFNNLKLLFSFNLDVYLF